MTFRPHRLLLLLPVPIAFSVADAQTTTTLELSEPITTDGIYLDAKGRLLVAAGFAGGAIFDVAPDGRVTALVRGLNGPVHLADDEAGNYYVSSYNGSAFLKVTPDGQQTVLLSGLDGPSGVARGPDGAFYVAEWGAAGAGGRRIHRVTSEGKTSVFAEGRGLVTIQAMAFDDAGNLYVGNARDGKIHRIAPDGTVSPFVTLPPVSGYHIGHMVRRGGTLYVTHPDGADVYAIDLATKAMSVVVSGAPFVRPGGITASLDGSVLWVADRLAPGRFAIRRIELGR